MSIPLKARVNRGLFPVDVISIRARPRTTIEGVLIAEAIADETLKISGGGGGPSLQLGPQNSIDIFVHDDYIPAVERPPASVGISLRVAPGEVGIIQVRWEQVNGHPAPGVVCVVWSYADRRAGRLPLMAIGTDAEALWAYGNDRNQPIPGALLSAGRRLPRLRRRDIKERIRSEQGSAKSKMMTQQTPPRLSSLAVEGFRGFREPACLRLAQPDGNPGSGLTIVVGANNTGKSTVWESFDAAARKMKGDVSFSEGRRNQGSASGVRIALEYVDGSSYTVQSRSRHTSETRAEWSPPDAAFATHEIVSVPSRRQFQPAFNRGGLADREWMSRSPEFTRFRQMNDQFTGRLFDLHNDPTKKALFDALMERILGAPLDWTIELADNQMGMSSFYLKVLIGENANHTSEGLGDGVISLLYTANALYDSEPHTLLVLDEPELSLHPPLVRRLGAVLADFARDRQIVLFTHSPHLVSWDHIEAGAEIARVFKLGSDSRIAQPNRSLIDGVSIARRGWRNPHTFGTDATEALFLDDGIIVVEGQDDAALLPRAFEQLGIPLTGQVFGWGSAGKDNIARIVGLLNGLGFSRVVALFDNNAPDAARKVKDAYPNVHVTAIPAPDIRDKPPETTPAVVGLFDKRGRGIKIDLEEATRQVLQEVASFIATPSAEVSPSSG